MEPNAEKTSTSDRAVVLEIMHGGVTNHRGQSWKENIF